MSTGGKALIGASKGGKGLIDLKNDDKNSKKKQLIEDEEVKATPSRQKKSIGIISFFRSVFSPPRVEELVEELIDPMDEQTQPLLSTKSINPG